MLAGENATGNQSIGKDNAAPTNSLGALQNTVKALESSMNIAQSALSGTVNQSVSMVYSMNSMMEKLLLNGVHIEVKSCDSLVKGGLTVDIALGNNSVCLLRDVSFCLRIASPKVYGNIVISSVEGPSQDCSDNGNSDSDNSVDFFFKSCSFPIECNTNVLSKINIISDDILENAQLELLLNIPSPATKNVLQTTHRTRLSLMKQAMSLELESTSSEDLEDENLYQINGERLRSAFDISPLDGLPINKAYTIVFKDEKDISLIPRSLNKENNKFIDVQFCGLRSRAFAILSELL